MSNCFSFTELLTRSYRSRLTKLGFQSTTTDIKNGTVIHCWVPKTPLTTKPNLLLIHGFGATALWQWIAIIHHVVPHFNVYVPDLLFFGDSFTNGPGRSESFQAECLMRVMEGNSVKKLSLVGLSYGGFVAYSMAAQFKDAVERVVICCAGVCMEENDLRSGIFKVSDLEEAARILVPQNPQKLKELVGYAFYKPPPIGLLPSCFLNDFIDTMCREYVEEKIELLRAITKDRKISNIPKITQPTLIIWGDHDHIFHLELACRLKRHVGDNAELAVIKNAGHAFNLEKPKEFVKLLKSFLVDLQLPIINGTK